MKLITIEKTPVEITEMLSATFYNTLNEDTCATDMHTVSAPENMIINLLNIASKEKAFIMSHKVYEELTTERVHEFIDKSHLVVVYGDPNKWIKQNEGTMPLSIDNKEKHWKMVINLFEEMRVSESD